jgi:carbonic anhydrase/acetyltransferase-like protein (isoleucine patch superfamily)
MSAVVRGLVRPLASLTPVLGARSFVAEHASVLGAVTLGDDASVWYGAVLRGDVAPIRIGQRSNIQDLTVIHATQDLSATVIGDDVTVGHRVVLHGCTVGDHVLVGMGSIVLDLAVIERDVVLAAGSLVPPRARLESGYLYVGSPARRVRPLRSDDLAMIDAGAQGYVALAAMHR